MKLISFLIACHNSCGNILMSLHSLLPFDGVGEIIIIDDGSDRATGLIADEYAAKYPEIIKAVHICGGGFGACFNKGLELAEGLYFKIVEPGDELDGAALSELINAIKTCREQPDLIVTNIISENTDGYSVDEYKLDKYIKRGLNTWADVKPFKKWNLLPAQALMYKTSVLKGCGIVLPELVLNSDNYLTYKPLAFTKNIYYLNVDLYLRGAENNKRIKNAAELYESQYIFTNHIIYAFPYDYIKTWPRGLKKYLKHSLRVAMVETLYLACQGHSPERTKAIKDMWKKLKIKDKKMYRFLRYRSHAALLMPLPWKHRKKLADKFYTPRFNALELSREN